MLSRPSSASPASPSFLLRSATEKAASSSTSTAADGNESEGDIRSKANRRGKLILME